MDRGTAQLAAVAAGDLGHGTASLCGQVGSSESLRLGGAVDVADDGSRSWFTDARLGQGDSALGGPGVSADRHRRSGGCDQQPPGQGAGQGPAAAERHG